MDDGVNTTMIQDWVDRLGRGDPAARSTLLECARDRLARIARKMLKDFPGVGRWEQTDDVLQNALIRLDRALKMVVPPTARDFFRLAAAQIRRELIDLARRYSGPENPAAHHSTCIGSAGPATNAASPGRRTRHMTRSGWHAGPSSTASSTRSTKSIASSSTCCGTRA
jgi:RNA polymerase sigma-70 factor (ECF subfamily)